MAPHSDRTDKGDCGDLETGSSYHLPLQFGIHIVIAKNFFDRLEMIIMMMIPLRSAITKPQPHPRGWVCAFHRISFMPDCRHCIRNSWLGLNSGFWLNAVAWIESLSSNQFPIFDGNLLTRSGLMNINDMVVLAGAFQHSRQFSACLQRFYSVRHKRLINNMFGAFHLQWIFDRNEPTIFLWWSHVYFAMLGNERRHAFTHDGIALRINAVQPKMPMRIT